MYSIFFMEQQTMLVAYVMRILTGIYKSIKNRADGHVIYFSTNLDNINIMLNAMLLVTTFCSLYLLLWGEWPKEIHQWWTLL